MSYKKTKMEIKINQLTSNIREGLLELKELLEEKDLRIKLEKCFNEMEVISLLKSLT